MIPAFNEEERLADLLDCPRLADRDLADAGLEYLEAVIVDDGSSDRTAEMLDPQPRTIIVFVRSWAGGRTSARAGP